jgi:hypothetical protein
MTDIDRATALALIAGRLSDYPVIRRLPDDLKAELEPLERGKHYGAIIERLGGVLAESLLADEPALMFALIAAAKAQESRLAALCRELENAVHRNRELREALEKSAEERKVALALLEEADKGFITGTLTNGNACDRITLAEFLRRGIAALKPTRLPDGGSRYAVRRAVLDEKTCDFCRMTDGAAGPIPPVDCEHAADPDSDEHCRCVMVAAP